MFQHIGIRGALLPTKRVGLHIFRGSRSETHGPCQSSPSACLTQMRHNILLMHFKRSEVSRYHCSVLLRQSYLIQHRYRYSPSRFATTIWQQVEEFPTKNVPDETKTNSDSEVHVSADCASSDPGRQCDEKLAEPLFMRKLGGIEGMYEFYASRGSDISAWVANVQSVYPIPETAVRRALQCVMIRHPLLKSSIKYDTRSSDSVAFVENRSLEPDFHVLDRSDWLDVVLEEANRPFDNPQKPLWRFRMLKGQEAKEGYFLSSSDEASLASIRLHENVTVESTSDDMNKHKLTFIISVHHAIMDAGYCLWVFQEFVNFLDAYLMKTPTGAIRKLPMLLPIEDYIEYPHTESRGHHSENPYCQARMCSTPCDTSVLDAYNAHFSDEIDTLSKHCHQQNCSLYLKLSQQTTSVFMNACVREKCKTVGALTAASVLALLDLIYPEECKQTKFEIPIESIIDLRRVYDISKYDKTDVPYFPGVAMVNVPVIVNLQLNERPVDACAFWNIARYLASFTQNQIGKPNEYIFDLVKRSKEIFNRSILETLTKKSPYVLCVSNIGKIDNVLHESVRDRIRITDLCPHVSVLTADMPIFYVGTQSVNGRLNVLVSYCKSYTSTETALCFTENLRKYIDQSTVKSVLSGHSLKKPSGP